MRKFSLYFAAALLALLIAGSESCKKVNGINNRQVVETPYSLYYSDTAGALFNSTDGKNVTKLIFPPDGFPCRAICNAGPNILWAKTNLYLSIDDGKNFNHTYDSLRSVADYACNNLPIDLNQSMLFNVPTWNRVYTMSNADPGDATLTNYLGLVHNDTFGIRGHWELDIFYDTFRVGIMPVAMWSLTQLANGVLCGLAYDKDLPLDDPANVPRNFYKTCAGDICRWTECTSNPDGYLNLPQYYLDGVHLPNTAPSYGHYSLGHFNNRLIAIDGKCTNGAWYSDDTGRHWTQYQGLPTNVPLLCIAAPFEETCLIGTDSAGLYMLNLNTDRWELNTNGLEKYLKVRSISFKENVFKNGTAQRYVYIATDKGIYQSADGGHNWTRTIPGNYVAIY